MFLLFLSYLTSWLDFHNILLKGQFFHNLFFNLLSSKVTEPFLLSLLYMYNVDLIKA